MDWLFITAAVLLLLGRFLADIGKFMSGLAELLRWLPKKAVKVHLGWTRPPFTKIQRVSIIESALFRKAQEVANSATLAPALFKEIQPFQIFWIALPKKLA